MKDNQCLEYVFDPFIKREMKHDCPDTDGKRRCYNKVYRDGLCRMHWNRKQAQKLTSRIKKPNFTDKELAEEFEIKLSVKNDTPDLDSISNEEKYYDILCDIEDLIAGDDLPKKWMREIRQILISMGTYKAISNEDLSLITCTGAKYDFILKGQKYIFDKHPEFRAGKGEQA